MMSIQLVMMSVPVFFIAAAAPLALWLWLLGFGLGQTALKVLESHL
jgi:hypothetical protein